MFKFGYNYAMNEYGRMPLVTIKGIKGVWSPYICRKWTFVRIGIYRRGCFINKKGHTDNYYDYMQEGIKGDIKRDYRIFKKP